MRSATLIFCLAFIGQSHAKDAMDELIDKMINQAVMEQGAYADLDDTLLAKPGQTAIAPRAGLYLPPLPGTISTPSHMQATSALPLHAFSHSNPGATETSWAAFKNPTPPAGHIQTREGVKMRSMSVSAGGKALEPVSIGLVGYGLVGKEMVGQIVQQTKVLAKKLGLELSVLGVADIPDMYLGEGAEANFNAKKDGTPCDLEKFGEFISKQPGRKVIVDCTAADIPGNFYAGWLAAGVSVATPNKKLGSGPLDRYKKTFQAGVDGGSTFFYEATVGAGLPIISTLQELINTGDEIETIEGILSGTLSYLFNVGEGRAFSEVIQDASEKGFTEPDPRDDLSGLDVQRKALILARECGLELELSDIPCESLVPEALQKWEPTDEDKKTGIAKVFIEKMKEFDGDMGARMEKATKAGEVLRYVATIDVKKGTATVGLGQFPKTSPFAATQYADNIVSFNTIRYTPRPLVVQGPGAGAAVTAGGIFGDVLKAALKG